MPMFTRWKSNQLSGKIESEVKNMDNLAYVRQLNLLTETLKLERLVPKKHKDIKKMYMIIEDLAFKAETASEITNLITVKESLDFLVKGVLK